MRVLVGGATGYLGRHVVRELHDRGHEVRALARDRSSLDDIAGLTDDIVVADATDPGQLTGCCEGVDAVISTIGLMKASARTSFHKVDFGANRNLLDEAERAGTARFVYVSVLQRPGMEKLAIVRAKLAFEAELGRRGIGHTILRPNGYFSDMDQYLAMARKGRAYVFGHGRFRINPIDGADVAVGAVDALDGATGVVELGGPEVLTHRQIADAAFTAVGQRGRVTSMPAWIPHALAATTRHVTPERLHGAFEFVLTVLSRDLVAPATGTTTLAEHFDAETRSDRDVHGD